MIDPKPRRQHTHNRSHDFCREVCRYVNLCLIVLLAHAGSLPAFADQISDALLDSLSIERIEVDMIEFRGKEFASVDNRLLALQLVEKGLTNAAMFMPDGRIAVGGFFQETGGDEGLFLSFVQP